MDANKTSEKILIYLKMNGQHAANALAKAFNMTSEGMRLHLTKLENHGLVESESVAKGVGRPTLLYHITNKGGTRFPDNHAPLAVQLIESVQDILGQEALDLLIDSKRKNDFERYEKVLAQAVTTDEKLLLLTEMRNNEGYMAQLEQDDQGWLFIENNCPICIAAKKCSALCSSEIENIRKLLGEKLNVEREDHSMEGDRRCSYRIAPHEK